MRMGLPKETAVYWMMLVLTNSDKHKIRHKDRRQSHQATVFVILSDCHLTLLKRQALRPEDRFNKNGGTMS